ncbi:class I adenylate-forming enzyme family protein [Mycolicibacterium sp. P9-22]|uniref:class I adenylate-forming enzyme family protein n=1 Tax=Mycolicibacterium sp. P9-22 TaxID=2024613 RepID=UPI0011EC27F1|nr:fatty acid--CoA ligase family protein [Mycolicibacterium sp. P9-22]KAA0117397.1 long-chain fatty acid--CoA ligase [Mycolicibacterium sp. P9-22]
MTESFTERFAAGLASYGDRPCIEFEGRWYSGAEVASYGAAVTARLDAAGLAPDASVALVVRNRYPHAAATIGALAAGRPVAMIYSFQSPEAIAADIERLDAAAVLADPQDWTDEVITATQRSGAAGVALGAEGTALAGAGTTRQRPRVDGALAILTSGTTGPPKRFVVRAEVLEHTVFSVTGGQAAPDEPPELVYWPLGGIGGVCQLVTGVYVGKRMVLMERFSVPAWVDVVKTHRLQRVGVQPAVVRMLLEADLPAADLSSLQYVMSASGPLDVPTRDAFEQRYGIPVLTAYGATEFAGSVCTWTPDLYREFGARKRASSGRALPGVQVRIIDGDTGAAVPTGERGILTAKVPLLGPDWVRTTDIASIDEDGFVTLHGRADGAINRGGFKIIPETIRGVLISHPEVRDAGVVGVPDARLGQVPFAAVETVEGATVSEADLLAAVRAALPAHHVPVSVVFVDELPRTPSLKVSVPGVSGLYRPAT